MRQTCAGGNAVAILFTDGKTPPVDELVILGRHPVRYNEAVAMYWPLAYALLQPRLCLRDINGHFGDVETVFGTR